MEAEGADHYNKKLLGCWGASLELVPLLKGASFFFSAKNDSLYPEELAGTV